MITGWAPKEPLLGIDDSVYTLGSCFARELLRYLTKAGVSSKRVWIPSGLNNSFAILDFFSWCATGQETGRGFRYDRLETGEIVEWKPEGERQAYADEFAKAGAFVFTFGLAEVWEDKETGGVFWRGVPEEIFDADRHVFRLSSVEENTANIRQIIEHCRAMNPDAPVVLTLSPVPLMATFRDVSCITADAVSKSVLRVALDQVMRDGREGVYYWPSYEVVKWVGPHLDWPAYGLAQPQAPRRLQEARRRDHRRLRRGVLHARGRCTAPHRQRNVIRKQSVSKVGSAGPVGNLDAGCSLARATSPGESAGQRRRSFPRRGGHGAPNGGTARGSSCTRHGVRHSTPTSPK